MTYCVWKNNRIYFLQSQFNRFKVFLQMVTFASNDQSSPVGQTHAKFFNQIRPAIPLVEVSRLINPEILVEIEVDAIITKFEII
jgi:enamine deaminase RidA (YjgF/YER057c/UK114 family)